MRKLFPALLFILAPTAWAQCSGGGAHTLADGNLATLSACLNSINTDGTTVIIPAGTFVYTSNLTYNQTNSFILQGAGAISSTTGGASTTGTDQTIFVNHVSSNNPILTINTIAGKSLRVTGVAITEDSGSVGARFNGGSLSIRGTSQSVRIDHSHFVIVVGGSKSLAFNGSVIGVVDHVFISTTQTVTNNLVFENGEVSNDFGNQGWATTDNWGSVNFMFVEDSRNDGGYISDCGRAGRWVFRNSTAVNTQGLFEHGTHDEFRGCRAGEVYNNSISNPTPFTDGGIVHSHSGTHLVWGNNIQNFKNAIDTGYYRTINNNPYGLTAVPNGFGACGPVAALGPSPWDQNATPNGYACLDQPGRGSGDLLTNFVSSFTDVLNSTTGTRVWPRQALSPIFIWNITLPGGGAGGQSMIGVRDSLPMTDNVDYFQQFGALGEPGSFNGTAGVGTGTLAPTVAGAYTNAPNCTTGTGTIAAGTTWLGVSVSGHWGPGYWNSSNTTLYVCTATNTWTAYYKPFVYPHPLTNSAANPNLGFTPNPVNFGTVTIGSSGNMTATVTNSGTANQINANPYFTITGVNSTNFTNLGTGTCSNAGTITANGGTCTVNLRFTPTVNATANATLTINGTVSASVSLTGFGQSGVSIPAVPTNLAANVTGSIVNLTWTASTGTPTSYNCQRATISGGPYTTFASPPGTNCSTATLPNGTYFFVVNACNSAGCSANSTQVSATVATAASATLTPSLLNLGPINIGNTTAIQTATLSSTGTTTLTGITINPPSGPNAADFSVVSNTCPSSLTVGTNCTFGVTFTPSLAGNETASIPVTSNDPNSPDTISLFGTGTVPVVISPTSLNFGNQFTNKTSAAQIVTYFNNTISTVTFSSIALTTGTQFAISANTCGASVAAGASCTVSLTFKPTSTGNKTDTLTFTDSAFGSPHTVTVQGNGKKHGVLKVGAVVKWRYEGAGVVRTVLRSWRRDEFLANSQI